MQTMNAGWYEQEANRIEIRLAAGLAHLTPEFRDVEPANMSNVARATIAAYREQAKRMRVGFEAQG
jgi:hypothetical protein